MNVKGFQLKRHGGPEVLQWGNLALPPLGAKDVLVRHRAIGVNFIDLYFREGIYPMELPGRLGVEAAGVVEAVGSEVTLVEVGQRVCYCMSTPGAYAEANVLPQERLIPLPDAVSFEQAAAVTLKGMTVAFLLHSLRPMVAGDCVLVHAAAGGVGQLLCQWGCALGLRVIGTVGSEDKVEVAQKAGCQAVIQYRHEDVAVEIRRLTAGKGVEVVYDSVGADTCESSLSSLARRGWFVTFGNASGPAPPISPMTLLKKGSLVMTRPSLADFIADRQEMLSLSERLFGAIADGILTVNIGQTFPLHEAAKAHEQLKSRRTTGATILLP